ncbi:THMS2 protein, partial [Dromaius novaehollandiae]|nr:THMS2 protein [Dromaius novaehollandiae]
MEPLSFQEYICSLNPAVLPRILRICSGVYFQGSVYEISGSECCLSTGDLLKIIAIKLQNVICKDVEREQTTELPLTFRGEWGCPGTAHCCQDPGTLRSHSKPCWLQLPLSLRGRFFECGRQQDLTLQEVLGLQGGWPQCLLCPALGSCPILLSPVYEVQAIMHLRKDVVKIPSTLEVDVEDVTEEMQHIHFIKPLLLSEVLQMEEALPVQAEILEGPSSTAIFKNDWIPRLQKGQQIQIHGKGCAWRILASARKGTRHFLLSSTYQGRFRRRPREFTTVYELAASLQAGQHLRVVVTQDCEGHEEDVPSLSVGDRLEVRCLLQASTSTTVLLCNRSSSEEEEDQETEELMLPLDLGGSFVEETCDSKKYSLAEVLQQLPLPCDVKVVAKDPSLARDILSSFSVLRLEACVTEPFLVSSFCEEPNESFEIPPRWLDMSLFFLEKPVHPQAPSTDWSRVEELKEPFYYHLLKQLPGSSAPPPPRPPKRKGAGGEAAVRTAKGTGPEKAKVWHDPAQGEGGRDGAPVGRCSQTPDPPPPPLPSPCTDSQKPLSFLCSHLPWPCPSLPCSRKQAAPSLSGAPRMSMEKSDSDHDYETVDEDLQKTIRKMQTVFPF